MDKLDFSRAHFGSDVVVPQVDVFCSLVVDWVLAPLDATGVVFIDHDRSMAFHLLLRRSLAAAEDPQILVAKLLEESAGPYD